MTIYKLFLLVLCCLFIGDQVDAKVKPEKTMADFCGKKGPLRAKNGKACNNPSLAYLAKKHCRETPGFEDSKCAKNIQKLKSPPLWTEESCQFSEKFFGPDHPLAHTMCKDPSHWVPSSLPLKKRESDQIISQHRQRPPLLSSSKEEDIEDSEPEQPLNSSSPSTKKKKGKPSDKDLPQRRKSAPSSSTQKKKITPSHKNISQTRLHPAAPSSVKKKGEKPTAAAVSQNRRKSSPAPPTQKKKENPAKKNLPQQRSKPTPASSVKKKSLDSNNKPAFSPPPPPPLPPKLKKKQEPLQPNPSLLNQIKNKKLKKTPPSSSKQPSVESSDSISDAISKVMQKRQSEIGEEDESDDEEDKADWE